MAAKVPIKLQRFSVKLRTISHPYKIFMLSMMLEGAVRQYDMVVGLSGGTYVGPIQSKVSTFCKELVEAGIIRSEKVGKYQTYQLIDKTVRDIIKLSRRK